MASAGSNSTVSGRERASSNASGKRRRTGSKSGKDENRSAAKTNLDVIVENWVHIHPCLGSRDVVHSSRTCSRLHDLCIDEVGRVRANEIDWNVDEGNFDKFYGMLQSIRFDGIKTISLSILGDTAFRTALTVPHLTIIYSVLGTPRDVFPLLKKLRLICFGSFPNGLQMLFEDFGLKLAKHSPALRELTIHSNGFSQNAFELVKPVLKKNTLTKLELCHNIKAWQNDLIGSSQARELAALIVSSSNMEYLEIKLESDELDKIDERVSWWFKANLVPAIKAGLGSGNILTNQSRLRYLCFKSMVDDGDYCLRAEELELLLNHFSGPHLSEMRLFGNWLTTGRNGISNIEQASADAIGRVLSRTPSLAKLEFSLFVDNDGCLWTALARFAFEKDSSCEVGYYPQNFSQNSTFFKGLRKSAEFMITCIKGRGGGSKCDAAIADYDYGWTLVVSEVAPGKK